ncbi:DNA (cytosine-5-)-methyltransferase [Heyndrickxia sporothermodurans]|uniref:DNA cytosine methyltransferase n=1 Tax=Heyndrickxia sporothermodurans TaxID=46224 RepID=UPI002E21171C|nr:DNA (cytosine-5-)-methyltransferase [Heyndrickxia sporothermodurans]MED3650638.1 DNA (cytosine-5-)-methyltransferase [Heyndrickxia sporothermodurans]MED3697402.1 DNA (cytosine-5-)-methyltransferase [Heyndrickxia sporothermodurans]
MKSIELFAGIGGIALAAEWAGIETVAFCERDPFCQKVLYKHWPNIPIFDDVRDLNRQALEEMGIDVGAIKLISGGFPCQPFSIAGKKKGRNDDRDLWPEMFRIIRELQPAWVVGENVANFANMELERTLIDLESEGYETQTFIIPASSVNAKHKRNRCFIVAYSDGIRRKKNDYESRNVEKGEDKRQFSATDGAPREWTSEPRVGRVADGVPDRVDRIRSLGNAVVPQQIYPIFEAIMKLS